LRLDPKPTECRTYLPPFDANHCLLVSNVSALAHHGVIKGNIAIPDVDPRTWRSRCRKRKQPALVCGRIVEAKSPAEIDRDRPRLKLPIMPR
jgi:hypothetical protein